MLYICSLSFHILTGYDVLELIVVPRRILSLGISELWCISSRRCQLWNLRLILISAATFTPIRVTLSKILYAWASLLLSIKFRLFVTIVCWFALAAKKLIQAEVFATTFAFAQNLLNDALTFVFFVAWPYMVTWLERFSKPFFRFFFTLVKLLSVLCL